MRCEVMVDTGAVAGRLRERVAVAQAGLDAAVLRDCAAYVPYRTGALLASGEAGGGEVRYTAAYARRVYYGLGMRFGKGTHPLAGAQWFERGKAVHGGEWVREVEAVVRG